MWRRKKKKKRKKNFFSLLLFFGAFEKGRKKEEKLFFRLLLLFFPDLKLCQQHTRRRSSKGDYEEAQFVHTNARRHIDDAFSPFFSPSRSSCRCCCFKPQSVRLLLPSFLPLLFLWRIVRWWKKGPPASGIKEETWKKFSMIFKCSSSLFYFLPLQQWFTIDRYFGVFKRKGGRKDRIVGTLG